MNQLPWWPPVLFLALALVGYAVMRVWSNRLDREEEEERRHRPPAE
jgi:hypothetical protein